MINEVAMQDELPDFPNDNTDRIVPTEKRNSVVEKSGVPNVILIIFLSVTLSTLISGSLIFSDKEKITENVLSVFGIKPEQKQDPLLPVNNRIDQLVTEQQRDYDSLKTELSDLKKALTDTDASREILTHRIVAIEKNVATFRNETIKKFEAQKNTIAIQRAKAVAATKPKEVVNLVTIVSIRGWGNAGFVTLKEGLDYSDLLAVGDAWRGWTLLSVDANARKAIFSINGHTKELVL
jgi:hypothetical protein